MGPSLDTICATAGKRCAAPSRPGHAAESVSRETFRLENLEISGGCANVIARFDFARSQAFNLHEDFERDAGLVLPCDGAGAELLRGGLWGG
jgi:hypothetical protein